VLKKGKDMSSERDEEALKGISYLFMEKLKEEINFSFVVNKKTTEYEVGLYISEKMVCTVGVSFLAIDDGLTFKDGIEKISHYLWEAFMRALFSGDVVRVLGIESQKLIGTFK